MRDYEEGEILTSIYSAQGVDSSRITISGPIPAFNHLGELRRQFESDAEALANHLQARLPGGTLDALLRKLLERRALLLVVPLPLSPRVVEQMPDCYDFTQDDFNFDQARDRGEV